MAIAEIGSYLLELIAGDRAGGIRARITLRNPKGDDMGVLCFVEAAKPPPMVPGGQPIGYYPVAHYPDMVDMLRHERPVYLILDNAGTFTVGTKPEPVGDDEGGGPPKATPFVFPRGG